MRLLLPESADSSLTYIGDPDATKARAVRLRLRMQTLFSILLDEQIYLTEGWALDSVAALDVILEVGAAVGRLKGRVDKPARLARFSPFRVELRPGETYLSTFTSYLRRGDCKWSGFPSLRGDIDLQNDLAAKIENMGPNWTRDSAHRIFADAFDDHLAGEALANIANYTSLLPGSRLAKWSRPPGTFFDNIAPHMQKLSEQLAGTIHEAQLPAVAQLLHDLRSDSGRAHSSSRFLQIATEQLDSTLLPAVDHLVRVTYMETSTRGVHAKFGAPTRTADTPLAVHLADQAAAAALSDAALEFTARRQDRELFIEQLDALHNWSDVWDSAITLALSDEWRLTIEQVRKDGADLMFRDSVFDLPAFARAERMLVENCERLALVRSRGERMGLSIKISKGFDRALQIATVSIPLQVLSAGAGVIMPVGGELAGAAVTHLGERLAEEHVTPLAGSKETVATVLRLAPIWP